MWRGFRIMLSSQAATLQSGRTAGWTSRQPGTCTTQGGQLEDSAMTTDCSTVWSEGENTLKIPKNRYTAAVACMRHRLGKLFGVHGCQTCRGEHGLSPIQHTESSAEVPT